MQEENKRQNGCCHAAYQSQELLDAQFRHATLDTGKHRTQFQLHLTRHIREASSSLACMPLVENDSILLRTGGLLSEKFSLLNPSESHQTSFLCWIVLLHWWLLLVLSFSLPLSCLCLCLLWTSLQWTCSFRTVPTIDGVNFRLYFRSLHHLDHFTVVWNPTVGSMPSSANTACMNPSTVWWKATNTSRSTTSWTRQAYITSLRMFPERSSALKAGCSWRAADFSSSDIERVETKFFEVVWIAIGVVTAAVAELDWSSVISYTGKNNDRGNEADTEVKTSALLATRVTFISLREQRFHWSREHKETAAPYSTRKTTTLPRSRFFVGLPTNRSSRHTLVKNRAWW